MKFIKCEGIIENSFLMFLKNWRLPGWETFAKESKEKTQQLNQITQ
jgi:hypothetical protein